MWAALVLALCQRSRRPVNNVETERSVGPLLPNSRPSRRDSLTSRDSGACASADEGRQCRAARPKARSRGASIQIDDNRPCNSEIAPVHGTVLQPTPLGMSERTAPKKRARKGP